MNLLSLGTGSAWEAFPSPAAQLLDLNEPRDILLVVVFGLWLIILPIANFFLAWKLGLKPGAETIKGCVWVLMVVSPVIFLVLLGAYILERATGRRIFAKDK